MDDMLREYLPILVFLAVAIGLGLVLILAAVVVAVRNPDPEKVSAYECGFNAFDDARMKFDVRVDPLHHLRSRNRLPLPMGRGLQRGEHGGLLVDDGVLGRADGWLRL